MSDTERDVKREVHPTKRASGRRSTLFGWTLAIGIIVGAGAAAAFELWHVEPEPEPAIAPARFAKLVVEPPPSPVPRPSPSPDAPEQSARKEAKSEDRKKVMAQGLLSIEGSGAPSNVFGPGALGTGINNALGGGKGRGAGDLEGVGSGVGGLYGRAGGGVAYGAAGEVSYRARGTLPVDELSSGDGFQDWGINGVVDPVKDPLSTFAIDVDTASYTIVRRFLREGREPPPHAVRVEELLNYFRYDYVAPSEGAFAVHLDAAPSPFSDGRHVLRVGIQGKRVAERDRKPAHLTFLVDVSGSMASEDRLELAKRSLHVLVDNLRSSDSVALVTYAGYVSLVLPHTSASRRAEIHAAIDSLGAGGSTAMSSGIDLAYAEARKMLQPGHVSRVIVLSDGDANVGVLPHEKILARIQKEVNAGVTLTTVGFGMGNYQDERMEQLADKGNGNAYYVDTLAEARRIFEDQIAGTLEVIAKDVKVQVAFDPNQVKSYRLVGYENRDVADADFRKDEVDGGEIGAGHSVTALYDVELHPGAGDGLVTVHVRAKDPEGQHANEWVFPFRAPNLATRFDAAPRDLRFATAVMAFGERLRGNAWALSWPMHRAHAIARDAVPVEASAGEERREFVDLVRRFAEIEGGRAVD